MKESFLCSLGPGRELSISNGKLGHLQCYVLCGCAVTTSLMRGEPERKDLFSLCLECTCHHSGEGMVTGRL